MLYEVAQSYLDNAVKALYPDICVQDNLINKPSSLPCVAIEVDGSRLQADGGGSSFTGEHEFSVWVIVEYGGSFTEARSTMMQMVENIIGIERFYCEKAEYGNDIVHGTKCVLARLSGAVA